MHGMRYLRRKLSNLRETLDPEHLRALLRGAPAVERKQIRRRHRPTTPAPEVKRAIVREYALRYRPRVFIETGTYHGEMPWAMMEHFPVLHTIELYAPFAQAAREKFRNNPKVTCHEGDSTVVLPRLRSNINEPCLFWLDGHSNGVESGKGELESPILAELQAIMHHPVDNHIILIDDALMFDHGKGYPSLAKVQKLVQPRYPNYALADDIVRLTP